jgi:hypothetical protein
MTAASDWAHLRQLAQAAKVGLWPTAGDFQRLGIPGRDADFIAAADPATILALCDALDHAEEREAGIERENDREMEKALTLMEVAFEDRDAARAALNTLRTELEALADEWSARYARGEVLLIDYGDRLRALLDRTKGTTP